MSFFEEPRTIAAIIVSIAGVLGLLYGLSNDRKLIEIAEQDNALECMTALMVLVLIVL